MPRASYLRLQHTDCGECVCCPSRVDLTTTTAVQARTWEVSCAQDRGLPGVRGSPTRFLNLDKIPTPTEHLSSPSNPFCSSGATEAHHSRLASELGDIATNPENTYGCSMDNNNSVALCIANQDHLLTTNNRISTTVNSSPLLRLSTTSHAVGFDYHGDLLSCRFTRT